MNHEGEVIRSQLRTRFNIDVTGEWARQIALKATELLLSTEKGLSYAYTQFVLADLKNTPQLQIDLISQMRLRDSAVSPKGVNDFSISRSMVLQLESIENIACAPYKRLMQLAGKESAYVENNECDKASWKKNRMDTKKCCLVKFTDGKLSICGIEKRYVPQLHDLLIPGTKVLLHSGLRCYEGLIQLTENNIKILSLPKNLRPTVFRTELFLINRLLTKTKLNYYDVFTDPRFRVQEPNDSIDRPEQNQYVENQIASTSGAPPQPFNQLISQSVSKQPTVQKRRIEEQEISIEASQIPITQQNNFGNQHITNEPVILENKSFGSKIIHNFTEQVNGRKEPIQHTLTYPPQHSQSIPARTCAQDLVSLSQESRPDSTNQCLQFTPSARNLKPIIPNLIQRSNIHVQRITSNNIYQSQQLSRYETPVFRKNHFENDLKSDEKSQLEHEQVAEPRISPSNTENIPKYSPSQRHNVKYQATDDQDYSDDDIVEIPSTSTQCQPSPVIERSPIYTKYKLPFTNISINKSFNSGVQSEVVGDRIAKKQRSLDDYMNCSKKPRSSRDDCMVVNVKRGLPNATNFLNSYNMKNEPFTFSEREPSPKDIERCVRTKLNIERLDILMQNDVPLPMHRNVRARVYQVTQTMSNNGGHHWSMSVLLEDVESTKYRIECNFSDECLRTIIGVTAAEAEAIRNSDDKVRRAQCQTKVIDLKDLMARDDIVIELKIFPKTKQRRPPVIQKIRTIENIYANLSNKW